MKEGDWSPWGQIEALGPLIPGAWIVETGRHGGIHLNDELNARVPEYVRRPDGWYEEDCEWSLAVIALADDFREMDPSWVEQAHQCAQDFYPFEYRRMIGRRARKEPRP